MRRPTYVGMPARHGAVMTRRGLLTRTARCQGRFSIDHVFVGESSLKRDPYELQRFVKVYEAEFQAALDQLRAGQHLRRKMWMYALFPQTPSLLSEPTPDHPSNRNVQERTGRLSATWGLRDLPPNELRGDDAAVAFLRLPTQPNGVNLRDGYFSLVDAAWQLAQRHNGSSTVQVFGLLQSTKIRMSAEHFLRAATATGDAPLAEVCAGLEKRYLEDLIKLKAAGMPH